MLNYLRDVIFYEFMTRSHFFSPGKISRAGLCLAIIILSQACVRDIPSTFPTDYRWQPGIAFPIGEADFGLKIPYGFDTTLLDLDDATGFPIWSGLEKIPMSGTIELDFSEILGIREEIDYVSLRVNGYNGFPAIVEIQAYLLDAGANILDSLFVPRLLMERAGLEGGGKTAEVSEAQTDIYFDTDRLDMLLQVKEINFQGTLENVFFFPEYTFKIQLAAVVGIAYQF